ncbi:MAG: DUF3800 domain-containing protein [Bacteroidota bacterium]
MNKYRIYIDEVGNSDLKNSIDPNHRYLSLTGIILDLNFVKNTLTKEIESLKEKYFGSHPDEPIIFHRKELVNKKFPFGALRNPEIEKSFNKEFLSKLSSWDYKIITVTIDKLEHERQYNVWKYDAYHYCMAVLLERYFRFLTDKAVKGDVMIESRGGNEDTRLKKSFKKIMDEGTNFMRSEDFRKVLTSKELKVKPKTSNIAGLQLADLIAYPSRTFLFSEFDIEKKAKKTFNDEIIGIIKNKHLNRFGKLKGWGLKLLP